MIGFDLIASRVVRRISARVFRDDSGSIWIAAQRAPLKSTQVLNPAGRTW